MADERVEHTRKGELPRVGDTLEEAYRLEDVVASGGMGVIMQATDLKMERDVAVKLLHPHMAEREDTAKRFEREIHLAKVLAHPNIIQLFDYGQTPGDALYIVMEYLEGEDLDATIKREAPLTVDRTLDIALQILDGLAEAHDRNVIHRDLKPSNVFLTERRRGGEHVKLLDFGIAKSLEGGAGTAVTSTGQICGTAMYMPPECVFQQSPGKRGDVYAVGLLILEMLLGERVFDAGTMPQTLMMHVQQPVPIPTDVTDTPLGEVLKTATVKHPDDRYPDADAMLDDLAEAADQMDLTEEVDPEDITETGSSVGSEVFPGMGGSDVDMEMLREAPSHESADAIPRDAPPDTPAPSSPGDPRTPAGAGEMADTDPSAQTIVTPSSRQPHHEQPGPTEKLPGVSDRDHRDVDSESEADPEPPAVEPEPDGDAPTAAPARHWPMLAAGAGGAVVLGLGIWLFAADDPSIAGGPSADRATPQTHESGAPPSAERPTDRESSAAGTEQGETDESANDLIFVPINVESDPSEATLLVEGERVGRTPTEVELPENVTDVQMTLRKSGFAEKTMTVDPTGDKREFRVQLERKRDQQAKRAKPSGAPSEQDDATNAESTASTRQRNRRDERPARDRGSASETGPEPTTESPSPSDDSSSDPGSEDSIPADKSERTDDDSSTSSDSSDQFENIADDFTVD